MPHTEMIRALIESRLSDRPQTTRELTGFPLFSPEWCWAESLLSSGYSTTKRLCRLHRYAHIERDTDGDGKRYIVRAWSRWPGDWEPKYSDNHGRPLREDGTDTFHGSEPLTECPACGEEDDVHSDAEDGECYACDYRWEFEHND